MVCLPFPIRARLIGSLMAVALSALALSSTADAQTLVLNQTGTQVTDTTIRSGIYASTNLDEQALLTRRSTDPDWERRSLLKFDTDNFISPGSVVKSATVTLTIKSGLGTAGASRTISAYREPSPFREQEATWLEGENGVAWSTPGGDYAELVGQASATNTPGSKVTFDVTDLVQHASDGDYDTRYTRLLLLDAGDAGKDSYREYYSSEEANAALRPTLTVVLNTGTTDSVSGATSTIKVLQWNIAQGHAPDGTSNLDRVAAFVASQNPDVISFNEIVHYTSASADQPQLIADKLQALTGQTWTYHWVQKWGASSGEGECVMTRRGIDATDDYLLTADRSIAMARLTVNGRIVDMFSTHLDQNSSATRLAEVLQLVAWTATQPQQRIIAGDFNGWPGTAEIDEMLKTHIDGWAAAKAKGTAVSYPDNPDGNTRNTRIDYVWLSEGATASTVTKAQVFDTRDASGKKPSDHNPLIVTIQIK